MTLRDLSWPILGLLIGLDAIAQDRLSRVESGYAAGTYLAHRPDYAHLYRESATRAMRCDLVRAEAPTTDLAICQWWVDDRAGIATLVVEYDEAGNAINDTEYPEPRRAGVDMALAGQGADLATTAIGIGTGLAVEANPVMAPLTHGAGWGVALGLKAGLALAGDSKPFKECVAWRSAASQIGWAAAAWNVVGIALSPAAGLGAAIGAWRLADAPATGDAVARCLEVR